MSKQLAIAASASIFAMAAFALWASPAAPGGIANGANATGAETYAAAPALDRIVSGPVDLLR
ncbi:hypothetical protein [Aurantiacibacter luteus]|uniref:Uncharacterized protein n=1 Tax=Aurantiacibacter luteus TaxID=1581420 RepID=A0A0G9MW35_9SPHN|nr:hypothetical protein [Aurantiacibacter luteus]KLE34774.1 hypothetical protein AAW00_11570 [Aurantiacibacter luteus]